MTRRPSHQRRSVCASHPWRARRCHRPIKLDAMTCVFFQKGVPKHAVLDLSGPFLSRHMHSQGSCPALTYSSTLYNWRRIAKPIENNNSNIEYTADPLLPSDLLASPSSRSSCSPLPGRFERLFGEPCASVSRGVSGTHRSRSYMGGARFCLGFGRQLSFDRAAQKEAEAIWGGARFCLGFGRQLYPSRVHRDLCFFEISETIWGVRAFCANTSHLSIGIFFFSRSARQDTGSKKNDFFRELFWSRACKDIICN